jgi:hypothetical protein
VSDHTLSADLAVLACTVAAVSPELADRAAALEVSRNQWRKIAQRAISANDCSIVRAEAAETLLTTERAARELAERRLAALEECFVGSVGGYQCAIVGEKDVRAATLTDLADAIIREQGSQQEATDATQ